MELSIVEIFRKVRDPRIERKGVQIGIYPHVWVVCGDERSTKLQRDTALYKGSF
jgi:hypothetical protein